jgi:DNA-binding MarR family transcriptional regulator
MATTSTSESRPGITQELRSSTAYLLKRLGFGVKDRWVAAYEPTGLMPQHQAVLSLLAEGTCTAQGQIAERLDYDASQVVDFLDDLEQRGLVTRRRDPADRRRHLVTVTPEGHEKLQELTTLTKSVEKDFLAPLDADERRTLHDLLLRLAAHHDARFGS